MDCVAGDDLHEELADDDPIESPSDSWVTEPDAPAPFTALPYPLLQDGSSTQTDSLANLLVNLLGVGVLAMPRAVARGGLLSGLIVMSGIAATNRETLLLLAGMSAQKADGHISYPEVARCVLGPHGLIAVLIAYLLYAGGFLVAYFSVLADLLGQILAALGTGVDAESTPRVAFVLMALFLAGPGLLLWSPRQSPWLSRCCMAGVLLLVFVLLVVCLSDITPPPGVLGPSGRETGAAQDVDYFHGAPGDLLAAASVFAAQLSVHAGGIEVLVGREAPEQELLETGPGGGFGSRSSALGRSALSGAGRWGAALDADSASRNAFITAVPLVGILGAVGYVRFGNNVAGNVLSSLSAGYGADGSGLQWFALLVARAAYCCILVVASAFMAVPCRAAALELFASRRAAGGPTSSAHRRASKMILGVCGLLAWMFEDLFVTLRIVGAWAAGPLGIVLPSLIAMELARQEGRLLFSAANLLHFGLLALGLALPFSGVAEVCWAILSYRPAPGHRGHRVVVNLANITASPRG